MPCILIAIKPSTGEVQYVCCAPVFRYIYVSRLMYERDVVSFDSSSRFPFLNKIKLAKDLGK